MGRVAINISSARGIVPSPTRLRYSFLVGTVFGASFLIFCLYNNIGTNLLNKKSKNAKDEDTGRSLEDRFTINTEGCSIPQLKPLDENIKQFVFYPETIKPCRNSGFSLVDNNSTHIWIKEDSKGYFNINRHDTLNCCYQSFFRPDSVDNIFSSQVDNRVKYNKCIAFSEGIEILDEFVKIECKKNKIVIYEQFFPFAKKKKLLTHSKSEIVRSKPAYNILILGIDAVSRLNFHRTMPKTHQFLINKGAVELLGYNKVGDNTFPNVIPMLLGIKETELKQTCLPNTWSTFDNCPFIWQWFKQNGYYTAFGEDSSFLGTFNYQRSGFIGTPTDFYLHTFINEAERIAGNNKDFNSFLCMNEKRFYDVLLQYIADLTTYLASSKLFGFFWEVTMSHDYLNYPMAMDNSYKRFLCRLDDSKYLDETILFLVSDHGLRWGKMRATKQGRLEERLPFVYVLMPQSFSNKYSEAYKNLQMNSKRLTNPFDIHFTLKDLLDLDNIKNDNIEARKLEPYGQSRGISLFLPILKNRTCHVAAIDDHWCTCQKSHKLSLSSGEALVAASQLVQHLNLLLTGYLQCATLKLVEILEVSEVEVGTPGEDEVGWQEYLVVIRTEPGGAIFEATLRHGHRWSLAGTVSRLNLYGEQSHCIQNYQLKLYCFCI